MKISSNFLIPAALLALISCSEPKNSQVVEINKDAPLFPAAPAATQPGQAGATANVNPPHGQPGHNCAVPVGAPLNGAPAPAPNLTTTPGATPAVSPAPVPQPVQTQVLPGTNPPHGQPGHDCAIPVGAPLKSK